MIDTQQGMNRGAAYAAIRKEVKTLGGPVELSQTAIALAQSIATPAKGVAVGREQRTRAVTLRAMDILHNQAPEVAQNILSGIKTLNFTPPSISGGEVGMAIINIQPKP